MYLHTNIVKNGKKKWKDYPPPDDIVRCLNTINDTLSKIMVEIKEVNELMRELLFNRYE